MALTRLYTALRGVAIITGHSTRYSERFNQAMDDDFNTPVAVAVLFDMARELNKDKNNNNSELASQLAGELKELSSVLGILQDDPESFLQAGDTAQEGGLAEQEIELFIEQRIQAKQNKDWALADKIRDDLKQQGIVLEDVATGTSWRRE